MIWGMTQNINSKTKMLQRLPIVLAQVNAGNTSEILLIDVHQIIYSLYWEKEVNKKVYSIIISSIKLQNRTDTIFMNSKNIGTSDPNRLLLNHKDRLNLKSDDKYVALWNISIYYKWKNFKIWYKNNKFKISSPTRNEKLELPDGSYSVSNIQDYFEYILKKHAERTNSSLIRI